MKRMIALIAMALVLLCACTPQPAPAEPMPLFLTYRGVDLTVGMAAQEAIAALGNDYTLKESESCAGQGMDRMYTYPSLSLYVFAPTNGQAIVSSVSYTDDGVRTAQGLCIGCSSADVISAMGEPDEKNDTRLLYRGQGATLTFGLHGGVVVNIVLTGE